MLSMHDNEQYLFEALRAGASGYMLKSVASRDLIGASQRRSGGAVPLPGAIKALMRGRVD